MTMNVGAEKNGQTSPSIQSKPDLGGHTLNGGGAGAGIVNTRGWQRWVYAVLAVPLAILLRFAIMPLAGPGTPFITLFPATVIVALLGGMGPSILMGILGVLTADYFLIPPLYSVDLSIDFWSRSAVVVLTSMFVGYVGDVLRTARAKAEQQALALSHGEERLRLSQVAANAGTWEWDLQTNKNFWSDEVWKVYGLQPHSCEPSYEAWLQTVHPEDRARVEKVVQEAAGRGSELSAEWRVRDRDGGERWLMSRGRPLRDAHGRAVRYIGIAMDITDRKRTEEELRQTRDYLETLFNHANAPIIVWDPQFRITQFNQAFEKLTGRDANDVLGRGLDLLFPEDRCEEAISHIRQAALGQRLEVVEIPIVHLDGTVRMLLWNSATLYAFDGKTVVATIAQGQDITDRKKAEEAVLVSEIRYRRLFEAARDGILILNAESGQIVDVNPFIEEMLGYSYEELLDKKLWEIGLFKDVAASQEAFLELQNKGYVRYENLPLETKDGRRIAVEFVSNVYLVDHQKVVQCNIRDITDRAQAEESLRQARDELEIRVQDRTAELSQANLKLAAEIGERKRAQERLQIQAQQLRALTSELTLAEQRERHRLAQVLHDHLQQFLVAAKLHTTPLQRSEDPAVREAASEVNDLIREAIAASRSLTAELSPPVLRAGGLIEALRWLARWMQEKHDLQIEMSLDEQAAPKGEDVAILLFQAVRELLFNVAKHSGVKTARVEVSRVDGQIQILIVDDGAGFDPSQIRPENGLAGGLGLISVRERLDFLGGRMEIESAPGQGSRFKLVVPMEDVVPLQTAPSKQETLASKRRGAGAANRSKAQGSRRIRVLLADDHVVMRQGLARLLKEEADVEVVGEAADGEAAIDLTRQLLPEVVIMDINMPRMTGIEATRVIHAEFPEVKVIGLSMFEELERGTAMRTAGAVDYLTKSGPPEAVIAAIRAHAGPFVGAIPIVDVTSRRPRDAAPKADRTEGQDSRNMKRQEG